jgi:dihydroorotate dehydrogenase
VIYRLVRSLLFRLDAELAHELTSRTLRIVQALPGAVRTSERIWAPGAGDERRLWGIRFRNPLGIAAGFDKNARLVPFLRALGFGFVEVGTVTLHPQPGNPKPRLFRYPRQQALVNRLGFNNDGALAVKRRLERWHRRTERRGEDWLPLLVNIGRNRDVEAAEAPDRYLDTYRLLAPLADGVVVNVSSPNTPTLRELQQPVHLRAILERLRGERSAMRFRSLGTHPILVKIAPDIDRAQLHEIVEVCREMADGIVATNTTVDHAALAGETDETGGLSGRPLLERSTTVLREIRSLVGPRYPLVGVGGVFTAADFQAKIDAGADLVQAYTGFVYEGPGFVRQILDS